MADRDTPIFTCADAPPLHAANTAAATHVALIHRIADFIPLLYPVISARIGVDSIIREFLHRPHGRRMASVADARARLQAFWQLQGVDNPAKNAEEKYVRKCCGDSARDKPEIKPMHD
ncbi:hypothetical protein [Paraburkholderia sartisoli]|uniref:hypothetical protein n=1 Tax=Paraburkholderia sartisoli TaxID=83784 RepID=UPI0015A2F792|nr:hypothetical protein [Paraburkholderia sartisoli]